VSQLVRNVCIGHTCLAIERTLGQGEPSAEDLRAFQKMLENEDAFPGLLLAARGERAMFHKTFEAVERGDVTYDELDSLARGGPASTPNWLQETAASLWRMNTREDHALFLSLMTRRIREVQLPMHEQAELEKRFAKEVRELPENALITRTLLTTVARIGETFRQKHAFLRSTIAALAAERYRRERGAWPDTIEKLCPKYLSASPLDPFDGLPLRYHQLDDGVVVYSVGPDIIDNVGNFDREHPNLPGVDIGVRLWDVSKRRQPLPAKQHQEQQPQ
jgi:hypothetical protein